MSETKAVALAALKSVEWTGEQHDRDNCWPACPSCGAESCATEAGNIGVHEPGCVLAAAIRALMEGE